MKQFLFLIISFVSSIAIANAEEFSKDNSSSVVKIFTHSVKPNYYQPWSMELSESSTGSGVLIEGNMVLTAAHVVSDATYIEVTNNSSPKKYFASVKWIAHDADLALLEVSDKAFFRNTTTKELGNIPNRQDSVSVLGYPKGGSKISITQGVISRIENLMYPHSEQELLAIQIDAAINGGNSGGPAFNNKGEIIGIAMAELPSANSIGYLIPVPIIKHVLEDIKDGTYEGFPVDGLYAQKMDNITLKEHFNMGERTGTLIKAVIKNSSADGYLRKDDVLLAINDFIVADDNTVNVDILGRISANHLISMHFVGEKVKMTILRNGIELDVDVPMKTLVSTVPLEHEKRPRYYIFAGMVFMPLTKNYLYAWGSDWVNKAPTEFLNKLIYSDITDNKNKEVVFIKKVLEDKTNSGYAPLNEIVTKVNNVNIHSLDDLVRVIENSDKSVIVSTKSLDTYILDKEQALKSEDEILKRYCIKEKANLTY